MQNLHINWEFESYHGRGYTFGSVWTLFGFLKLELHKGVGQDIPVIYFVRDIPCPLNCLSGYALTYVVSVFVDEIKGA